MLKGSRIADIGCDHGKLIKLAVDEYGVCFAIGVEISEKAIIKAKKLLKNYKNVELIVGDGLAPLIGIRVDSVFILGMGHKTIIDILNANFDVAKTTGSIIVNPLTNIHKFRKDAFLLGFGIKREMLLKEGGRFYSILELCYAGNVEFSEADVYVSKHLLNKKDKLYKEFLEYKLKNVNKSLSSFKKSKEKNTGKLNNLLILKKFYEMGLKCYE